MRKREAIKNLAREKNTFVARCVVAGILCVALLTVLLIRLVNLQIFQHDYYSTRADDNRMRILPVPPVRGLIYDRNGTLLAQNKPAFVLEITPEQVQSIPATLKSLEPIISLTPRDIERFKERVRKSPRYRGVPLRSNLSMAEVASFEVNRYSFHGVDVTAGLSRNYPLGETTAHVVGYVGGINEEELQKLDPTEYAGLTLMGKTGVEKSHEDQLRGTPGAKIIEANAYGRPLRELDYHGGTPGQDLYLSLDAKVQQVAEQALGQYDGAVVAIDPRNGEIIAMVSKPGFDPQLFVEGIDSKTYRELSDDPDRPLFNRPLQGLYPAGSTVKPAMALTGLEYGIIQPDHREFCRGEYFLPNSRHIYHCWKRSGHGWLTLSQAVMESCDIYFYQLAQLIGIDRMHESMTQFGLGHTTGVDLPQEKGGLYPSREWKRRVRHEAWYPGETLNTGIGQGYINVTPIQLAQMTARIAMRGSGFKPHIVHSTQDPLTGKITLVQPQALPPIVMKNPDNWETVIQAMVDVTTTPHGTAYNIGKDSPYLIAAKTGTAQVTGLKNNETTVLDKVAERLRDHALFIAFAPADHPQIAVAVIAEHGGHGGSVAGPVAREVMDMYLLGKVVYQPNSPKLPPPAPVDADTDINADTGDAPDTAPDASTGTAPPPTTSPAR
ncbi:MAG: penicillin-binding protein 2 [Stenotrophobium sp.]